MIKIADAEIAARARLASSEITSSPRITCAHQTYACVPLSLTVNNPP
jgi:hypothetical protein